MKKVIIIILVLISFLLTGCTYDSQNEEDVDYRENMRIFVQNISEYAKEENPDFLIIPQNGHNLLTKNGEATGDLAVDYLNAIDGVGREDLFYGYESDNLETKESETNEIISFMDIAKDNDIKVLVTDYCSSYPFVDNSFTQNNDRGYISFAADSRGLDSIPTYPLNPYNQNSYNITSLQEAQNFLYLINPDAYNSKQAYVDALKSTNYDVLIIDLFYNDGSTLTKSDIEALKIKANGKSRLVIAYMSIGEAEDYRYYWIEEWSVTSPSWLVKENPNWIGNYKVKYWYEEWQDIIYGNNDSYLYKIIDANFDGVYLDIIDGFEYFEEI